MANKRLTQVQLNGSTVTSYVRNWRVIRNWGNPIDSLEIEFTRAITASVTPDEGQLVEVWMGYTAATDTKVFSGYVESFKPDVGTFKVKAFSKMYAIVRNTIGYQLYDPTIIGNPVYSAGKYSDAFTDLVTTHAGLSADSTTVSDTGTVRTIVKFVAFETNPKERMDKIAEAFQWAYYYRPDTDKVYFHPKQNTLNTNILTVGSNVVNLPKWNYDKTDLINDLRVRGVYQETEQTDFFSGNGSNQSFTLTYPPLGETFLFYSAAKNYATSTNFPISTEIKVIGVDNVTTSSYDFTVDKAKKVISTVGGNGGGFTAAAGTNNVMVKYTALKEIPVRVVDDISIAMNLRHARKMTLKDTITATDVQIRAEEIVAKFKNPFSSAVLEVRYDSTLSFELGQGIRVVDSVNRPTVDSFLTIWGITLQYPDGVDEIKVGDREFYQAEFFLNMSEKLNALENEVYDENAIYTYKTQNEVTMTLEPHSLVQTIDWVNDTPIADSAGAHSNSIIYAPENAFAIDGFESTGNWAPNGSSIALTETSDSTAGHFWIGSQGLNYAWTATSSTGIIDSSFSAVDMKGVVNSYCLDFDGTGDYVTIPEISAYDFDISNDFTVNLWVNSDSAASANRRVFAKAGGGTITGYHIVHNTSTGACAFTVGNGTSTNSSPTITITNGTWTMVTAVWDKTNNKIRIYQNGTESGSGNTITLTGSSLNNLQLAIGSRSDTPGVGGVDYDGRIANVAVWSRALTPSEITTLFSTPNSTPSSGLVGWWKINDASGTNVNDYSSNNNDGAITNAVWNSSWFYPWQGTAGVWCYTPTPSSVSSMSIRIGSSSTDYKEYTGKQFAWKVGGTESSFALENAVRTLVLFDLDSPVGTSGTVDWTGADFFQIRWVVTAAGNITFDYLTCSKGNVISLCGAGERFTNESSTTTNY